MFVTLPVLVALSWAPPASTASAPTPAPQRSQQVAQATHTITCPVTGEQIPFCCCPVKK